MVKPASASRQPLRALPMRLQEQIAIACANVTQPKAGEGEEDRGKRWMKPKGLTPEKHDLKSVIEKRIGAMRKFLDEEQDHTATGTVDFTDGGHSFF